MSFKGIDHVVVRVGDIEAAVANYNKILGIEPDRAHSEALMADQAFYRFDNGTFLELISPTQEASPLTGSLNKLAMACIRWPSRLRTRKRPPSPCRHRVSARLVARLCIPLRPMACWCS